MSVRIYTHKNGMPSARALARACNGLVIRRNGSRYRWNNRHKIINWGATDIPYEPSINQSEAVAKAVDKLVALRTMENSGVRVPPYTTDKTVAEKWKRVVVRHRLSSRGGRGVEVIVPSDRELPYAPLYTKYIPKKDEYRVHVFRGEAFFVQRKARRLSNDSPNWQVRSHENGFVFAHKNLTVPEDVVRQAEGGVEALKLDLGGVDVIWNEKTQQAYVLEVNTAVGLEGETLQRYAKVLS